MEHQNERGVGEYFAILRRRKWIAIVAVVATPATAYVLASSQPKLFASSADVLLTNAATGASSPLGAVDATTMETQQEVAGAPTVAQRVVRAAHVTNRTAGQVRSEATFSPVSGASVLRIGITDADPALAAKLANTYAQQYTQYRRQLDTSFLDSTRREIEARMKALRSAGGQQSPVYAALAQKAQDLRQVSALQTVSAVVLRHAVGASQIQPRPTRYGTIGLILGILLGCGLALLWDQLDPRVRTTQDLSDLLALPVLGRLAAPPRRLRKDSRLVMLEEASGVDADGLRILRTNLQFVDVDHRLKSILVTSATGGEGKSTTIANLAVALARAGKRVVLVDLDLHRPAIETFFSLAGRPGLTTVALGHATLDEALARVPVIDAGRDAPAANGNDGGNGHPHSSVTILNVLPTGPLPPNPGEFVASDAVRSLLGRLEERADIVLVDAPPLLEMSDTLALSASVDGVIVVASLKTSRRPLLRQAHQILETIPAARLGLVVTGADEEKASWYGRYGSYYYAGSTPTGTAHTPAAVAARRS